MNSLVGPLIVAVLTVLAQVVLFAYRWGGIQKASELREERLDTLSAQISTLAKEVRHHETLLIRIADRLCLDHAGAPARRGGDDHA